MVRLVRKCPFRKNNVVLVCGGGKSRGWGRDICWIFRYLRTVIYEQGPTTSRAVLPTTSRAATINTCNLFIERAALNMMLTSSWQNSVIDTGPQKAIIDNTLTPGS